MLIAFAGASGRTDAIHAALLAAHAAVGMGESAVLLVDEEETALSDLGPLRVLPVRGAASPVILAHVAAACRDDGSTAFATIEPELLRDVKVGSAIDLAVVVVGPHLADEVTAARLVAGSHVPTRYVGCGRAGGAPALARFAASMGSLDAEIPVLPCVLPPLGRGEAAALGRGRPTGRALRAGSRLMAVLRLAVANVGAVPGTAAEGSTSAGTSAEAAQDERSLADRLRELADDVEAAELGLAPCDDALACAPVLDQWDYALVPTPVLTGLVTGHPNIRDGRPARTTEVFLTDRATYARTLSRWYALRTPAGAPPDLQ